MGVRPDGLRVVVVTHYWEPHVGGIESVARHQVERFAELGAEVEVHTTRLPRATTRAAAFAPVSGPGSLRIVRHRAVDVLMRTLRVPVPVPGPSMLRAVIAAARRADVVLVHGHTYPTSVIGAVAARTTGRPLVLLQHSPWIAYGPRLDRLERAVDRTLGRFVIASADRVIAVSEHTADYVRDVRSGTAVTVVPNGVDRARFRPSSGAVQRSAGGRPIVLFVGRLVARNGWQVLLDAWEGSDLASIAELRVVGAGPDVERLRTRAATLAAVTVVGRVDDAALADEYRAAAVVTVPSVTGEGFGLVAAEALACGTPVVASADGGLREVVRDDVDGLLVPPEDPRSLAAALRRVVQDDALRSRFADAAVTRDRSSDRAADAVLSALAGTVTPRTVTPEWTPSPVAAGGRR